MLAVHEEKISRQEQIDEIIFEKLKERAGEIDTCSQRIIKRNPTSRKKIINRNEAIKA